MNVENMQAAAAHASQLMKSLASETRLMILCQLADGEKAVGELTAALNLRQAAVSQQLALLRKDGLVVPRRDGQTVFYSLASAEVRAVIGVLYELFCGAGSGSAEGSGRNH